MTGLGIDIDVKKVIVKELLRKKCACTASSLLRAWILVITPPVSVWNVIGRFHKIQ